MPIREIDRLVIHKNPYAYSSWPDVTILNNGDWIIAFSQAMSRHQITHRDPTFHNLLVRSTDQGQTWSRFPQGLPGYGFFGIDCIAVTELSNGDLLAHTVRDDFVPVDAAAREARYAHYQQREPFPWAFRRIGSYVIRSVDSGYTWQEPVLVDVSPFATGFSPRAIVELSDGTLLLPQSEETLDPPQAFVVRSNDGGRTWGDVSLVAQDEHIGFWEPAYMALPSGKIIAMLRTHEAGGYYLYQCDSHDAGTTWTKPVKTPMWGYPAHMLTLHDGRVLCVYGRRRPPYGIRACLSADEGQTWDIDDELIIRDDFPNSDLGYPTSVQLADGTIFTTYYGQDDGVTCIQGSFYTI